jgi:MFS family permease
VTTLDTTDIGSNKPGRAVWAAWLLTAVFYFYQYAVRSCPAVMIPQISKTFGLSAAATASLAGLFYYGYALFSLAVGAALDRFGARAVIPAGALVLGCGAMLFGTGRLAAASIGRILQGAGGAFAFVGTVYIASRNFPPYRAATLIGLGQMFGMAGGSAGQFITGPLMARGTSWSALWLGAGVAGILLSLVLFWAIPAEHAPKRSHASIRSVFVSLATVFRNPQSILCGIIAGLLFIPTTIFDMIWGVRFLQEARGLDYASAVLRSAAVPLGWMIGSPALGWISDRLGRRKPVIVAGGSVLLACLGWILYGPVGWLPPYTLALIAGIASGAAMIPYTLIKEVNPSNLAGTATGVINFLNLACTALFGPVFGWLFQTASEGAMPGLEHYRTAFLPLLFGAGFAVLLTLAVKETGTAVRSAIPPSEAA